MRKECEMSKLRIVAIQNQSLNMNEVFLRKMKQQKNKCRKLYSRTKATDT
jgi:hypothetical protein